MKAWTTMSRRMQYAISVIAVTLSAVLIWAISTVVASTLDNATQSAQASEIRTYEEEYLPGQSLDAVRVNAPSFSSGKYAYKVADRTSGATGWLVLMNGEWVYIPVTLGNQQLIGAPTKVGE